MSKQLCIVLTHHFRKSSKSATVFKVLKMMMRMIIVGIILCVLAIVIAIFITSTVISTMIVIATGCLPASMIMPLADCRNT